jgi:LDH2 family malate/lactate/ureidoglycolate dehydrogenase
MAAPPRCNPAAPVRYPGQRAAGQRARSAEQGVLLAEAIYAQLRALGERLAPGHAAP